jgi:hypothetical protein
MYTIVKIYLLENWNLCFYCGGITLFNKITGGTEDAKD